MASNDGFRVAKIELAERETEPNNFAHCNFGCGVSFTNCKNTKVSSSYHLCVECFSQLSFDSEVYTKSATAADFVYTSESNESCEKHSTQR